MDISASRYLNLWALPDNGRGTAYHDFDKRIVSEIEPLPCDQNSLHVGLCPNTQVLSIVPTPEDVNDDLSFVASYSPGTMRTAPLSALVAKAA